MVFKPGDLISYSRYRGLLYNSRYKLSNEYIWHQFPDGSLVCTDMQCDIDCNGNIVLVLRDGKVYILGQVPVTEDDSRPRISLRGTTLHIEYACFAKDGLRGKYYETEDYNLVLSTKQLKKLQYDYLCLEIASFFHALRGHRRSRYTLYSDISDNCIYIEGSYEEVSRGYRPKPEHPAKQGIKCQNETWTITEPKEGNGFSDLIQMSAVVIPQVLKYLNDTRFRLVDEDMTNYYVLDITDGVIDKVAKSNYSKIAQSGINIVTDWNKVK